MISIYPESTSRDTRGSQRCARSRPAHELQRLAHIVPTGMVLMQACLGCGEFGATHDKYSARIIRPTRRNHETVVRRRSRQRKHGRDGTKTSRRRRVPRFGAARARGTASAVNTYSHGTRATKKGCAPRYLEQDPNEVAQARLQNNPAQPNGTNFTK
jgi:hypothetical protein